MDSDKYLEGQSMQTPPLFESDSFIYWKNRFETYVKSKDLDLWHVITNGDFQPIIKNPETKLDEVVPFEKQTDDLKRRLGKNNEAKMVIYNALCIKEYERIFMCNTAKEIWKTLLITHQDSAFARFNTIITSLKALDEESKDVTSLSLDELIGNLKVHEMIIKKDSEIVKEKVKRKYLALKAKKESSDEECSTSGSEDEEYAMAVRDFKKFFKRRGRFPSSDKNQRAFVGGSWSGSGEENDERIQDETFLIAQAPNEICLGVDLEPDEWIKDSGCSKHMTGNRKLFSTYKAYNGGNVIFGSNLRGNIIGKGTISNDSLKIDNVEHVDNLGFNLLSIGQICDNKCKVTFSEHDSEITKDGKVIGRGIRKKGLYVMKLGNKPKDQICLTTIDENSTLWHRRLGHANMRLIQSLASKDLVRNLPKLKFDQHFCDACKIGKQAHASHKAKNVVSTTRCLELLHMDLFGPSAVRSYGGNRYTLVIVDDYSRLVAQGYNQQEGINYDESYAPVARLESIRIILAYACALDFKLFQMDVKSAFLNGFINEEKSSNLIIVQIYVDDIIFGSTCQDMCDEFAKIMHDEFEMSMMGELNFFLGLQIKQMEDGIFFNQSKYIKEMLKKFGLEDSKPMKTLMSSDTKLTKDEECESVDSTKYRGMIGSLLYLMASRPDIMFSVCLCARFQEDPKTSHLEVVKHIFRYIKGTTHLGLWYPKGTDIETVVYADSDHAGDYVDQKSTSGICTFVGCCLTSWFSKKQTALAISTTKAEYVSAGKACQQALWMKQALIDYDVRLNDVPIMCDNKVRVPFCVVTT
ncbi:retrovirus-related pol polyprotein from transposon TNT 1-94 [Tanacetum coccineum]|uniref:Retrovirus-related pol polyprotein from transposon TNT 1-94 n=1 Tax=Tanacetum coccineum TaxID=301880 RepID=A0ABQ5FFK2_9ASTR